MYGENGDAGCYGDLGDDDNGAVGNMVLIICNIFVACFFYFYLIKLTYIQLVNENK